MEVDNEIVRPLIARVDDRVRVSLSGGNFNSEKIRDTRKGEVDTKGKSVLPSEINRKLKTNGEGKKDRSVSNHAFAFDDNYRKQLYKSCTEIAFQVELGPRSILYMVASHAQKYFKHLEVVPKAKRRESILDIISADAEASGTSQVVLSTKNESRHPQESINAEQTITVAEGESAGHGSLVSCHAQKYFKHLKSVPKAKRTETILDIISADAEAAGTIQVVLSTKNERTLPQESINAEQTITVAEGESAGHGSLVS
ncbi:hypothetical protein T459_22690 [Capsicum annuum]|uniref:Uncharacterized protein n=1 Tax=Capsicum annuum TaxID=4072 RepID=A0A2G2YQF8_CAPAN|nr:hypothetical protein T459_22690 [Capsicum annuum]